VFGFMEAGSSLNRVAAEIRAALPSVVLIAQCRTSGVVTLQKRTSNALYPTGSTRPTLGGCYCIVGPEEKVGAGTRFRSMISR